MDQSYNRPNIDFNRPVDYQTLEPANQPNQIPSGIPSTGTKQTSPVILLTITSVIVLLFSGLAFAFLVPISGQSLATRTLDSIGQHKLALQAGALYTDPAMAAIASIEPGKPESCNPLWNHVDDFREPRIEAAHLQYYRDLTRKLFISDS